jgi:uncharacterized repeat protein (TIGR01451 family)
MRFRVSRNRCAILFLTAWVICIFPGWGAGQGPSERAAAPGPSIQLANRASRPNAQPPTVLAKQSPDAAKARPSASYTKLPLSFEPNQGQTASQVKYLSQGRGYTLFLTQNEAVLALRKSSKSSAPGAKAAADWESAGSLGMKLVGADPAVEPTGAQLQHAKTNYYIGNDRSKWHTGVPNYGRVEYRDVYPGVDLVYYGSNQQQLEYDFVVKPGADPQAIRIAFDLSGMSTTLKDASLSIDRNGDLLIESPSGDLRFRKPAVYQRVYVGDGIGQRVLDGHFVLARNNEVSFSVPGYDKKYPLIIDPVLTYSSYLGGSAVDYGTGVAADPVGDAYVVGATASSDFPGTIDPIASGTKAFISQISSSGTLNYSTIFGGSSGDVAYAVTLNPTLDTSISAYDVYITGTTQSSDFPGCTGGCFQDALDGPSDAFVIEFSSSGGSPLNSTFLGGSGNEDGFAIALDSSTPPNIFVAGDTSSTDLVSNQRREDRAKSARIKSSFSGLNVVQSNYGGGTSDGFVAELDPTLGTLGYVTYLGGSGTDVITALAVDSSDNAYVVGRTSNSTTFPITLSSALFPTYGGGAFDAFFAQISPYIDGSQVLNYSTYLGGTGDDEATGIALDPSYIAYYNSSGIPAGYPTLYGTGIDTTDTPVLYSPYNVYITGSTNNPSTFFQGETGIPTNTVGPGGGKDAFVVKLSAPIGTTTSVVYANFYGGSSDDVPLGLFLDVSDNAYMVGSTGSGNFPLADASQTSCGGACDGNTNAFLTKLDPEGANLLFSTFLGGSGNDIGTALTQDIFGNTYLTGSTTSTNFPTQSPFQSSHGSDDGNTDAFVASFAGLGAIRTLPGFLTNVLGATDDDGVQASLGSNFNSGNGLNFFGNPYISLWVNANGNVNFGPTAFSAYNPVGLITSNEGGYPIIAPFWGDVDTRGSGSGLVTYGNDTVNGHNAFGVNWINVGYFGYETDKLNSFQLVLIDRQDIAPGDFDIEFNYGKIQWEAGDFSGGTDGQCIVDGVVQADCLPPVAGYTDGTGNANNYFQVTGSAVAGAFLDSNTTTGLIQANPNSSYIGRNVLQVRTGAVVGASLGVVVTPSPNPVPLNSNLTYSIVISNTGPSNASGVGLTDMIPSNSTFVSVTPSQGSCSGTTTVSCSLGTINNDASATVTLTVNVTSSATTSNTTSVTSGTPNPNAAADTGVVTTVPVRALSPPTIAKAFGASSVPVGGSTSLTFTIINPNSGSTLSGVGFTDTLPSGLTVSTPSNGLTSSGCGEASITAAAGSGSVTLASGSLAVSGTCTIAVSVTGTTTGTENNVTTAVTSNEGGSGGTASASLTVVAPPTIAKAFGASHIPVNGSTTLTFTITNPSSSNSLSGVGFIDTLPSGLTVSTPSNGLSSSGCGEASITAAAGSGSVTLANGSLATSGTCTISVSVTGATAGAKNNVTGAVTSNEGGTGLTASASINVVAPMNITKSFVATSIPVGGTTGLNFSLTNPAANPISQTGIAFTDTLPTGLVVATPNGLTGSCGGGTIAATAGTGIISLTGASTGSSPSCSFSVNVTGTAAGTMNNVTGAVSSNEGGTGLTATAVLAVVAPPTVSASFGASTVLLNGTTSLTYNIVNPSGNTVSLTGVGFTDTLPSGLTVSTPNGLTGSCGGGTINATAGGSSISLSGATIAASSSCSFSVNVTGVVGGLQSNSVSASSTNGGSGTAASGSVTVVAPIASLSSTSLTFGSFNSGVTSPSQGITVTNTGTGNLTFTSVTLGGANPGDFGMVNGCTSTVVPEGTCTITVTFTPTANGTRTASISIADNAGGSPQTVTLTGTGVAPAVTLVGPTAGALSFQHNVNLNAICPPKTVTVENTGSGPLTISSISLTMATSPPTPVGTFIESDTCSGAGSTVAAGSNCVITVTFLPPAVNSYAGTLTITDNATGSPHIVSLTGTGLPPCALGSSSSINQVLRTTASTNFTINDSTPSCHDSTVTMACVNNAPATCVFSPAAMAPGGSTSLTVTNLAALSTDNLYFTVTGTDPTVTTQVNLSVLLEDFSLNPYPTTNSVTAGQTATYSITVAPINGLAGTVTFGCQGAPTGASCTLTPSVVSLNGTTPVQVKVAVSTTARSGAAPRGGPSLPGPGPFRWFVLASLLALFGLGGWTAITRRRYAAPLPALAARRLRMSVLALAATALMLLAWAACGGGGGGGMTSAVGTPAGMYSVTVSGSFTTSTGQQTSLTQTQTVQLQVN